jgi:YgiT-type zinc finger domain-containing protein
MSCFACGGEYKKSTTTHFVDLKKCMVIVKNVPCLECEQCGDIVYDDSVVERLDSIIKKMSDLMTEIAVIDYTDNQAA